METIKWFKSFETGHPIVDGQHKNLFSLINNLQLGMSENHNKILLAQTVERLSDYIETHFRTEEDLMISTTYPDYTAHKQEHEKLKEQAAKLIQLFNMDKVDLTATVSKFLSDWLKHHINEIDIKMINWVKSQSDSP